MATKKSQRVFIWVIAIVMTVGTIAGFIAMMLAPTNQKIDQEQLLKQQEQIMAEYKKQQEEAKKANRPLYGYQATAFDKASVTELKVETLVQGTGETLKGDSTFMANYFGWDSTGSIFDSSNKNGTTTPVEFDVDGVVKGWTTALTGAKVGSTLRLTVPGDQGYGDTDPGTGQPFGPLMFVIEIKELK
jgi:FKBP-type peptidyl-prolyl cis-trans isomerase